MPELVENIFTADGTQLAYIIRSAATPVRTEFLTPDELNMQLGFIVYPKGGEVARHAHKPLERQLVGTTEVILVRRGRCVLDIYDEAQRPVKSVELTTGDLVMLVNGGHGFRMLEDTILFEVKQGPYTGLAEKIRF